MESYPYPVKEV